MDDAINTAAGATTPQDAPIVAEAPVVSLPYAIPVGMTPSQAQARVDELMKNPDFAAAYFKGGMDSREFKELDALQRHALGEPQPTKPAPLDFTADLAEQPPASADAYRLHDPYLPLDDTGKAQLGELQQLAHSAGLSQSWFESISKQAAVDASRYAGMSDDVIAEKVDDVLRNMFRGDSYDTAMKGAQEIIAEMEAKTPGLRDKLTAMGLNRNVALLTHILNRGLARASQK